MLERIAEGAAFSPLSLTTLEYEVKQHANAHPRLAQPLAKFSSARGNAVRILRAPATIDHLKSAAKDLAQALRSLSEPCA
jgi:hypothetical protein